MAQTQVANYTMEAFVEDVNNVFRTEADPHVQAKTVSAHLKKLLAVPGWVEEKLELAEEGGFGRSHYIWTKSPVTPATVGG